MRVLLDAETACVSGGDNPGMGPYYGPPTPPNFWNTPLQPASPECIAGIAGGAVAGLPGGIAGVTFGIVGGGIAGGCLRNAEADDDDDED